MRGLYVLSGELVAETCRLHHNKWDTRQLCFDVPHPLPISFCFLCFADRASWYDSA